MIILCANRFICTIIIMKDYKLEYYKYYTFYLVLVYSVTPGVGLSYRVLLCACNKEKDAED